MKLNIIFYYNWFIYSKLILKMNVRTTVVALLLFANLTSQKSMRIFVNNAVVDVSSYLVFDFLSDDPRQKYG